MKAKAEFDDRAFRTALAVTARRMGGRADMVVMSVGEAVVAAMKQRAPRNTGRLAGSIRSKPGRDRRGPYAEISVDPFYSSFVEWGATNVTARPFFRPGLEKGRSAMLRMARQIGP